MKVLVIGSTGQLATALRPRLEAAGHRVTGLTHAACDLASPPAVERQLDAHAPEAVINTAAFHQVDRCETAIEEAFLINGHGPRALALACEARGMTLVHVSTNYVFDGRRTAPYDETAAPNPLSVYGLSKLAGERLVQAHAPRHFIVRTTGLYGRHGGRAAGENFVERMVAAAASGAPLRVVNDQVMTPTYAGHLAEAMVRLLATTAYGLHHLTNSGACTWWEFARAILARAGLSADVQPVGSDAFGAAAPRPAYSVLASRRAFTAGETGPGPLPSWEEGLEAYFQERGSGAGAVPQARPHGVARPHGTT